MTPVLLNVKTERDTARSGLELGGWGVDICGVSRGVTIPREDSI